MYVGSWVIQNQQLAGAGAATAGGAVPMVNMHMAAADQVKGMEYCTVATNTYSTWLPHRLSLRTRHLDTAFPVF